MIIRLLGSADYGQPPNEKITRHEMQYAISFPGPATRNLQPATRAPSPCNLQPETRPPARLPRLQGTCKIRIMKRYFIMLS